MRVQRRYVRSIALVLCVALVLQLAGCGTLIHPDRRGQTGGRIDPAIAVLDGIGLLLFVIPGLVAFAIDFSTGAIYLPGTDTSKAPDDSDPAADDRQVVYLDPDSLDAETIERVVREETGVSIEVDADDLQAYGFEDRDALLSAMARANGNGLPGYAVARLAR